MGKGDILAVQQLKWRWPVSLSCVLLFVFVGAFVWNIGAENLWWGQSASVRHLWNEPVMMKFQDDFSENIIERHSPELGWGVKPVPASVSVLIRPDDSAERVVEYLHQGAKMDGWNTVESCSENFIFCATKTSAGGSTLLLTYQEGNFLDKTSENRVGKLSLSFM